jgi:hypothetical protein
MKSRKHLTSHKVNKLIAATKGSRNEASDRCFLLLMMLTRSQVMDLLRPLKAEQVVEQYRVRELALFGSLARQPKRLAR